MTWASRAPLLGYLYLRLVPTRPDGPRGDRAGALVLPPRVRRESHGRRLRRGNADRLRADAAGRRSGVRGREDLARPRRRDALRRGPRPPPLRAVQSLRPGIELVLRIVRGSVLRLRTPRPRRTPRRPGGRLRQATPASAAGREGAGPRPVRLRRGGPPGEPRDSGVVRPAVLLRRRAPRPARHHRYYAGPSSRREPRRIPDREEA